MSRPVLKPCPSCGKEQMTDEERGDSRVPYRGRHRICDTRQCGCVMRNWNARPLEDALQAEIDRLRAIIRKVEWSCVEHNGWAKCCPMCREKRVDGHAESCPFYKWKGGE